MRDTRDNGTSTNRRSLSARIEHGQTVHVIVLLSLRWEASVSRLEMASRHVVVNPLEETGRLQVWGRRLLLPRKIVDTVLHAYHLNSTRHVH